ncbi:MAG: ATP-binding protein [Clostridiaceae bacterium]|nr:ATP-binding protein [Clostridiaceae bacterium]
MRIERNKYLNKLIDRKENGYIKIITGIRRCGKSFLLSKLYKDYLISIGIEESQIVEIQLDDIRNIKYRNPFELDEYVRAYVTKSHKMNYIFIDEIQLVEEVDNPHLKNGSKIGFVDVLIGLMKIENIDIYVTGSNSKMLSTDILTEFKDRGEEIRVNPLSFKEFYDCFEDKQNAWREYFNYGGMPRLVTMSKHEDKSKYLKDLFSKTYITDVIERNNVRKDKEFFDDLLNILASSIGSLTNPRNIANTFKSKKKEVVHPATLSNYIDYLIDAFIISKANRFDVKGRKYIETPLKYYFTDIGLRNARLNFRQQEENHIMENIIFNELSIREFDIDIGNVEYNYTNSEGQNKRAQLEIDFVANKVNKRYYIQSALNVSSEEKRQQEIKSLLKVDDSFKKIVVVKDDIIPWHDDNGIFYLGIEKFLLDENSLDL